MRKNYPKICDRKRNNKVAIRNFNEAVDFHDVVKLMLVRMLRRKNNTIHAPIYTEYDPEKPLEDYPDIWMRSKNGDIYVWEIQKEITESWKEQILKRHEAVTLIIVDLKDVEEKWLSSDLFEVDPIKALREVLEPYVI